MSNISVSESLLKRLRQSALDAGDFAAAKEAEELLPPEIPTEVGTVIMWREDNDAGKNVGSFAERIHEEGEDQWRVNGFDWYPDDAMKRELSSKTWWIMEPKK